MLGNAAPRGGKFHRRLSSGERPIANKYREGKMKSTLKRELRECEIGAREADGGSGGADGVAVVMTAIGDQHRASGRCMR